MDYKNIRVLVALATLRIYIPTIEQNTEIKAANEDHSSDLIYEDCDKISDSKIQSADDDTLIEEKYARTVLLANQEKEQAIVKMGQEFTTRRR